MAIQHRRGADVDFKAEKMLPGEIAVTTDGTRKVYAAFAPGDVKELASKEEVQKIVDNFEISVDEKINEAVQQVTDEATVQVEGIVAKGEEILNSIPADYQETVKEVAQLTEGLVSTNQSKADAIICEAEGSVIVVTDSSDTEFEELKLFGRSEQVTTTGAQLLDMTGARSGYSSNSITAVVNADGSFDITGTATENIINIWFFGGYADDAPVIFVLPAGTYYVRGVVLFNKKTYLSGTQDGVFTLEEDTEVTGVRCKTLSKGETYNETIFPMLNVGSTPLPWEKYTGGKPGPNPEYPQEIRSAVASDVKVCGKNLLKNTATSQTINGVTFTVNEDGSITVNGTAAGEARLYINTGELVFNSGRYKFSGCPSGGGNNNYGIGAYCVLDGVYQWTFDAGEGVIHEASETLTMRGGARPCVIIADGYTANNLTFYPMLRLASIEDDTYEPYTENSITLSKPIELNGIGDVTDSIVEKDGVFGVERKFAEVVLDGTENWSKHSGLQLDNANGYFCGFKKGQLQTSDGKNGVFSHFIKGTLYSSNLRAFVGSDTIQLRYDEMATVQDLKSWLSVNNVAVKYQLAEPTFEPLPEVDQIALRSLHTYRPVTHITNDANAYMEIKYVADTENHIKQNYIPLSKYTALEERVAAIEELVIS